jgi:hypothetical protein
MYEWVAMRINRSFQLTQQEGTRNFTTFELGLLSEFTKNLHIFIHLAKTPHNNMYTVP